MHCCYKGVRLDWRDQAEFNQDFVLLMSIQVGEEDPIKAREKLGWRVRYKMNGIVHMMLQAERGERMQDGR